MTFPISPSVPAHIRTAPTFSYRGQNVQPNDGFPAGTAYGTLTVGTKIVVVVCMLAGGPAASGVTVGGVACTQACASGAVSNHASIWYLQTSLSGAQTIGGAGGSGRSFANIYEIYDYSSPTPYFAQADFTDVASASFGINVPTSTNTITFGAGVSGPVTVSLAANIGPSVSLTSVNAYESASSHFSWVQQPTARGNPTTYTASGGSTSWRLAAAAWR